ncbi:MAG: YgfZ/GcvT domain-containing protein [Hyphomicrobiaceae bacterium]
MLRITGADASDFLNGLVTADVAALADGRMCHAGLLAPQGKILFEFFILRDEDTYLLDVAETVHTELAKRLGFYKLRAAVQIEIAEDLHATACWGGAGTCLGQPDPRLADIGHRLIAQDAGTQPNVTLPNATLDDYDRHRIAVGVPESIKDYPLGGTFPHEACFDQLNGVSFTKGCYVGQEVVSRMRHRGTARKRTIQVEAGTPLPPPETPVLAGDRPIGTLGSSSGNLGIAMIRLDRAAKAEAAGTPITVDGVALRLKVPEWADFEIAEKQKEDAP